MAAAIATSVEFVQSRQRYAEYPRNLMYKAASESGMMGYQRRLNDVQDDLLTAADPLVGFIDVRAGSGSRHVAANSFDSMRRLLGELPEEEASHRPVQGPSRDDPNLRLCFLCTFQDSASSLKITRPMLNLLLTHHQVMPSYLDFIGVFGKGERPQQLRFSSFREQNLLSRVPRNLQIRALSRSGRQYQLCYNLKSVNRNDSGVWKIRQAAIHHQFDAGQGRAFWIIAQGRQDIREIADVCINNMGLNAVQTPAECFKSTLACHIMLCEWSAENWRIYIQALEDELDRKSEDVKLNAAVKRFRPQHQLDISNLEEEAEQAIMQMQSNIGILKPLRRFYEQLNRNESFSERLLVKVDTESFCDNLLEMINDCELQVARAQLLVRIATNTKNLVGQHITNQASDRMEGMTRSMFAFAAMAQKEATAMRVIAFVTLVYLPATFVSTFFSTDVVKYQTDGGFSYDAMIRWVQVTLPLTAITFTIAIGYFIISDRRRKGELLRAKRESPV